MPSTPDAAAPSALRKYPEGVEVKTWTGGCHCRRFTYEYEHPVLEASPPTSCNCSICTQKGELHAYGPESAFHFTKGAFDEATGYAWGKKTSTRFFCPTCGCQLLWHGRGRVGVNVRTFDGIDKLRYRRVSVLVTSAP
ncbi:Mss4-like protein [Phellopilus nigrolimitatus]|nr:Mss4-like protein [Phellopilus nigrolimitatus]